METNSTHSVLNSLIVLISAETGVQIADIASETKLEDLGVDSLDFLDLMQVIGEKFKLIPEEKFAELDTVGDIVKALE